ncbi:MAG: hypothetical protein JXA92_03875 [candidate division Zixibacteria bacterium]|nr:hypothetical protein [candidate division Zixibacteria bacterium]
MDETYNSLDSINPYLNPDKVTPAHHSERDKDRKFARTLKEKLEEDFEKRKKKRKKDALVLHGEDLEEEPVDEAESSPQEEAREVIPDDPGLDDEDKQEPGHIDVKA